MGMNEIKFWKMSGSGNDFILIDNRDGLIKESEMSNLSRLLCRRKLSVGADGVIFIQNSEKYDFSWRFFNPDGTEAEMCGNGSRCVARYAYLNGIAGKRMEFETAAGPVKAEVCGRRVKVQIFDPKDLRLDLPLEKLIEWESADFINTGVPHVVIMVKNIDLPVRDIGRKIRYHKLFSPSGTNVNFVKKEAEDQIRIRTYERGVEDETLSCGTGAIASALIFSIRDGAKSPVSVKTESGEILKIYFEKEKEGFKNVWLEGDTNIIYEGKLNQEALL